MEKTPWKYLSRIQIHPNLQELNHCLHLSGDTGNYGLKVKLSFSHFCGQRSNFEQQLRYVSKLFEHLNVELGKKQRSLGKGWKWRKRWVHFLHLCLFRCTLPINFPGAMCCKVAFSKLPHSQGYPGLAKNFIILARIDGLIRVHNKIVSFLFHSFSDTKTGCYSSWE